MLEVDDEGNPATWGDDVTDEEYGAAPPIEDYYPVYPEPATKDGAFMEPRGGGRRFESIRGHPKAPHSGAFSFRPPCSASNVRCTWSPGWSPRL